MLVRKATPDDKGAIIKSFRQLYADWDYLPIAIDCWLNEDCNHITWLACDDKDNNLLVAMTQAYEIEPGDWYLRCLRSNPSASYFQNANAVMSIADAIEKDVRSQNAKQVRYGTIDYFEESLRLSEILKFREFFRIAHAYHDIPESPREVSDNINVTVPDDIDEIHNFILETETLKKSHGYFFTWWDTRKLRKHHVEDAKRNNLLFEVRDGNRIDGLMMMYQVPWQKHVVLPVMEGSYESLIALFNKAVKRTQELEYDSIGLIHVSHDELYHRQNLLGLKQHGTYSVQLIRDDK